ncbi:enoyl-CoA hydratase/isomerase family protein [Nostoc sp. 3335mG]|nr:enoyl-CoA hydratase/isomerase family protein [Nostoc sp. 3335mG]
MLQADWRDDGRAYVLVDLASWPADLPIDPLPPVPVIGVGPAAHPQARRVDMLVEPPITLDMLASRIAGTPRTAATLIQLLRAIDGLPPERALPLESFAFAMLQAGAEHRAWLDRRTPAPPAAPGTLHATREGDQLDLLIDRPQARNAIDRAMRDALHEAFALAAIDPGIARIRLRGRGRCFSMGADLAEFGTTRDPAEAHSIRARTLPAHMIARRAAIIDVHVQGGCVGSGLEMAAFAGRITAEHDAWFQLPEVAMGIIPGAGGCVSIPRRIGRQRAATLMISGQRLRADVALRWGLVDALVDYPATDDRGADEVR